MRKRICSQYRQLQGNHGDSEHLQARTTAQAHGGRSLALLGAPRNRAENLSGSVRDLDHLSPKVFSGGLRGGSFDC